MRTETWKAARDACSVAAHAIEPELSLLCMWDDDQSTKRNEFVIDEWQRIANELHVRAGQPELVDDVPFRAPGTLIERPDPFEAMLPTEMRPPKQRLLPPGAG
jgi:hypothetical protein